MKTGIFKLMVVTLALFTVTTYAQPGPEFGNGPRQEQGQFDKGRAWQDCRIPSLTEDQQAIIKEIRMTAYKETKPLRDELRELKAHQQTLLTADQPDIKAINAGIDKVSEIKNKLAKIMAKEQIEIRAQLTDEQKMQFDHRRNPKGFGKDGKRGMKGQGMGKGLGPGDGSGICPRL